MSSLWGKKIIRESKTLINAAKKGDTATLQALLSKGVDIILGSVDIHFSHKYIAAIFRNDIKLSAVLSYRVAILRKCLSLLNNRSIRLRSL